MSPRGRRLTRAFYRRDPREVGPELLGKLLVRGGRAGRIVEVEAYVGEYDLACHAAKGRTARTEVLFGPPGRAYVYLIYGMHHCFNVVTSREGRAAAVLVRGVEPLEGLSGGARTDGPGRLCDALGITLQHNRADLLGDELFLLDAPRVPAARVALFFFAIGPILERFFGNGHSVANDHVGWESCRCEAAARRHRVEQM